MPSWISPRQAAPLGLLGGDHPLGELLQGVLAGGQAAMQPRLVDYPGEQGTDRGQEYHVPFGKHAAGPGVHVQHARQPGLARCIGTDAIEVNSPPRSSGKYR